VKLFAEKNAETALVAEGFSIIFFQGTINVSSITSVS